MASDSGFLIPFEEKLKCGMCKKMIEDARIVPCGHTFCLKCIDRSASQSRGKIRCSDCKGTSKLPSGGAGNLPRCMVTNGFLDEIKKTFGQGSASGPGQEGVVSIGRHGFQLEENFNCSICLKLMTEPRYLRCGHSFCVRCLMGLHRTQTTPGIECSQCKDEHPLPPDGVNGLPVGHRIRSIAREIRDNKDETSTQSSDMSVDEPERGAGSNSGQSGSTHGLPRRAPGARPGGRMEDFDDEKRKAQAEYQLQLEQKNGETVTLDVDRNADINGLRQKVRQRTGLDPGQYSLTCNGRDLREGQRSLGHYNIANHSTVNMTPRLAGG